MREDNKDIQMFREDLWARRTTTEIKMIRRNKTTEDSELLKEIQRNKMKKHEMEQELKKEDGLTWEQDGITYMNRQIYILNNKKIMILQM